MSNTSPSWEMVASDRQETIDELRLKLAEAREEIERLRVPPELAEPCNEMLDEFENEKDPQIGTTMVWWGTMGAKTVIAALKFCAGRKP